MNSLYEFQAIENPDYEESPIIWRCYACGNTSKEKGFYTHQYWTDYGYEYDCVCNACGSDDTAEDGQGEPLHECGELGWDCWKCNKFCCSECWKWFDKREYHEEEDYICNKCNGD